MADHVLETHIRLTDVQHLFKESDDPFDPDYEASGTLEQIANELYAHTTYRSVRLTLELPPAMVTDDVRARLHAAIDRYCDRQIRDDDRNRLGERARALVALAVGLVALGLFVVLDRALRNDDSFWANFFSQGVTVGFWVALWFPVDTLVMGQWQHRLDRRIYNVVRELELVVVPSPAGAALG